ncbi:MAG: 3-carboxy-cis,cis-muconate cycloisomerase [Pseudomonadota bacterium]
MILAPGANPLFALFQDEGVSAAFEPSQVVARYCDVEAALTRALADQTLIDRDAADAIVRALTQFTPDWHAMEIASVRDGLPVPGFVAQVRAKLDPKHRAAFHFGATSQDIMDTATALAIRDLNDSIDRRMANIGTELADLSQRFGQGNLMGRTRMQAALPIGVAARVTAWRAPIIRLMGQLASTRPEVEQLQLAGPVGNRAAWGERAGKVARHMASELRLKEPGESWHTGRDGILLYGGVLSAISQALGKIGMDLALMAQQGIDAVSLKGGGTSSAMAHKQNPVRAELLITLGRYNAALLGGLHQAGIQEQERSGAAWPLEWLVLPQMLMATGAGLSSAQVLLRSITSMGEHEPV